MTCAYSTFSQIFIFKMTSDVPWLRVAGVGNLYLRLRTQRAVQTITYLGSTLGLRIQFIGLTGV